MMAAATTTDLVARICVVSMFPPSAIDKIWHWRASLTQTDTAKLPVARYLGPAMLIAAIAVEAVTPALIVARVWDRPAALILAAFCVVTAVLYHPFWAGPDFFADDPKSVARDHFWQFLKNFCIVGGLLLIFAAGSGP